VRGRSPYNLHLLPRSGDAEPFISGHRTGGLWDLAVAQPTRDQATASRSPLRPLVLRKGRGPTGVVRAHREEHARP